MKGKERGLVLLEKYGERVSIPGEHMFLINSVVCYAILSYGMVLSE